MDVTRTLAELVPHTGKMRLLDDIVSQGDTFVETRVRITEASMFFQTGNGVPVWIGMEYMAQSMAAWSALQGGQPGVPARLGLLVGVRGLECAVPAFAAGQTLRVRVDFTGEFGGLAVFDGSISDEATGAILSTGSLRAYQPDDVDAYLKKEIET